MQLKRSGAPLRLTLSTVPAASVVAILLVACSAGRTGDEEVDARHRPQDAVESNERSHAHIAAAVAHSGRPEEDRKRDADRKPAEVLAFFGIEPGMQIVDLMGTSGYYTEILARAVGTEGKVYALNAPAPYSIGSRMNRSQQDWIGSEWITSSGSIGNWKTRACRRGSMRSC